MLRLALLMPCLAVLSSPAWADSDSSEIAAKGYAVLQQYCLRCHGDELYYPGLDLRDRHGLLQPSGADELPFLVPGDLAASRIWRVMEDHIPTHMPPEDEPQPTEADMELVRKWIEAGGEFPKAERAAREFVGERALLEIIAKDIQQQPLAARPYARYFSLVHLWNHPQVTDEQLQLVRAAVSKLINSMSSQPRVVPPATVDDDGLVLRIDLRNYGWTNSKQWQAILKEYPYGLETAYDKSREIAEATQSVLPYVRADWFVHSGARPPLYHQLVTLPEIVGIPERQDVLEQALQVDVAANFLSGRVWRAGISGQKSGVSEHNRIVERHDSKYGYFWQTFDCAGDEGERNFSAFPNGPKSPGRTVAGAFEHDGGEIIFSMPNRLQSYMLVSREGDRIDEGPVAIVRDPQQFAGSYAVVNGISCIGCHRHGLVTVEDSIRELYLDRPGQKAEKVQETYAEKKVMDEHLSADTQQYLAALEQAIGPFVREGSQDDRPISEFTEPITASSKLYGKTLSLSDVARELGLPDDPQVAGEHGIRATAGELTIAIRFSEQLRKLELGPLVHDERITRAQWERVFGRVARELGIGVPKTFD